jgi:hypothetical protein
MADVIYGIHFYPVDRIDGLVEAASEDDPTPRAIVEVIVRCLNKRALSTKIQL